MTQHLIPLADIVAEINRVRESPEDFADVLVQRLTRFRDLEYRPPAPPGELSKGLQTKEGVEAVNEVIAELRDRQPIQPVRCEEGKGLSRAAADLVTELCETNVTTGGPKFADRLSTYGRHVGSARELRWFGASKDPHEIVCRLLVDDGNPNRNNRKLLLDPEIGVVGTSSMEHKAMGVCLAMIFAQEYHDNENAEKEGPVRLEIEAAPDLTPEQFDEATRDHPADLALQNLVTEINRARQRPQVAADYLSLRLQHFRGLDYQAPPKEGCKAVSLATTEGAAAVKDAIEELRRTEPMEPIRAEDGRGMMYAAEDLCQQLVETGQTSGGDPFADRMARYGEHAGVARELRWYGDYEGADAREVTCRLLIDDGSPNRTHRKLILDPDMRVIAASYERHPAHGICVVMIIAEGFKDNKERVTERQAAGSYANMQGA